MAQHEPVARIEALYAKMNVREVPGTGLLHFQTFL